MATEIDHLDQEPGGAPIIDSYGGKSLHKQSHGESFFAVFANRLHGKGLYILDEPEAALSPTRQMAMISRIHELVRDDSQFIIATHSPIIMAYPNATIFWLSDSGIDTVRYEDTEHYQVSKSFFLQSAKMVERLINDEQHNQ
ncbi:MAG: AAA family ATPase [Gammaproteobacteria bacterium]